MPSPRSSLALLCVSALSIGLLAGDANAQAPTRRDLIGSRDFTVVPRPAGSVIVMYTVGRPPVCHVDDSCAEIRYAFPASTTDESLASWFVDQMPSFGWSLVQSEETNREISLVFDPSFGSTALQPLYRAVIRFQRGAHIVSVWLRGPSGINWSPFLVGGR